MDSILFDENRIKARNLKAINQKFNEAEQLIQSIRPTEVFNPKEKFQGVSTSRRAVNYVITMMVLGWAYFLLGTFTVLPFVRVGYEVALTKYDKLTVALVYLIYSYYFMSAPFMGIAQIIYVMVGFALFNNIDFYALFEGSIPSIKFDMDVPLYVDQGVFSWLRTAGYNPGFISSYPRYYNSIKSIDSIYELANFIKNSKAETPSLSNADILDLLLDNNDFMLSSYKNSFRGGIAGLPSKFTTTPGELNNFINPEYQQFIEQNGGDSLTEQIQAGVNTRKSFINSIEIMGFFRNRNRALFAVGALLFVILAVISYVSTFDNPIYRMRLSDPEEYKKIKLKLEENNNITSNIASIKLPTL